MRSFMLTEQINVRMDTQTKTQAESIFSQIGVSPTDAVRMFYKQVIMRKGLPFDAVVVSDDFESKIDASIKTHAETLSGLAKQ